MSDADAAPAVPASRKYKPPTGERLGKRAVVAEAMIATGATYRDIQEATGISSACIAALKKQRVSDPEEVEKIKRKLRDKCVVNADVILDSISTAKIAEAPLGELVRSATKLMEHAGIGPISHHEIFKTSINRYVKG